MFDSTEFIANVGNRLIRHFEDARQGTTPTVIGNAIEDSVRREFEQILPRGIAVGSGCVIDSYGNCSKQQDVILYERDICPVFSINNAPESTYYPCEGVIGVVEVKSSVGTAELRDAFEKIQSVRQLRRHEIIDEYSTSNEPLVEYRHYGSIQPPSVMNFPLRTDRSKQGLTEIGGALLTANVKLKSETLRARFWELNREFGDEHTPNRVEILGHGAVVPVAEYDEHFATEFSAMTATHFMYVESAPLRNLLHWIFQLHRHGITSPAVVFDRYIVGENPIYHGKSVKKSPNAEKSRG